MALRILATIFTTPFTYSAFVVAATAKAVWSATRYCSTMALSVLSLLIFRPVAYLFLSTLRGLQALWQATYHGSVIAFNILTLVAFQPITYLLLSTLRGLQALWQAAYHASVMAFKILTLIVFRPTIYTLHAMLDGLQALWQAFKYCTTRCFLTCCSFIKRLSLSLLHASGQLLYLPLTLAASLSAFTALRMPKKSYSQGEYSPPSIPADKSLVPAVQDKPSRLKRLQSFAKYSLWYATFPLRFTIALPLALVYSLAITGRNVVLDLSPMIGLMRQMLRTLQVSYTQFSDYVDHHFFRTQQTPNDDLTSKSQSTTPNHSGSLMSRPGSNSSPTAQSLPQYEQASLCVNTSPTQPLPPANNPPTLKAQRKRKLSFDETVIDRESDQENTTTNTSGHAGSSAQPQLPQAAARLDFNTLPSVHRSQAKNHGKARIPAYARIHTPPHHSSVYTATTAFSPTAQQSPQVSSPPYTPFNPNAHVSHALHTQPYHGLFLPSHVSVAGPSMSTEPGIGSAHRYLTPPLSPPIALNIQGEQWQLTMPAAPSPLSCASNQTNTQRCPSVYCTPLPSHRIPVPPKHTRNRINTSVKTAENALQCASTPRIKYKPYTLEHDIRVATF